MRVKRQDPSKPRSADRRYQRAAVVAIAALALVTAAVFLKQLPFTPHYTIRGVFASATQLKSGSDVRVAGLKIGQVDGIERGPGNTALVSMHINDAGRPIHADATLEVRPRLILEGNAYIDVRPGTPYAPELRSGATIPLARTAISVQLDQVLDVLTLATRGALHRTIREFNRGLGGRPGAPFNRGPTGYGGLRRAVREFAGALPSITRVARAVRGTAPGDLPAALDSTGDVTGQLAQDPRALADLVTNFDRVTGTLAARDQALAATIRGFDGTLKSAPVSLSAIDGALPSLTRFGRALRPALHAAPASLRRVNVLLDQTAGAVSPPELPAMLSRLAPVGAQLPGLEGRLGTLFRLTAPVTDCISTHVVPALDMKIQDGSNTTGDPVYLDLVHLFTGLTAFSSAVDGNGGTVRLGITSGDRNINQLVPGVGKVVGRAPSANGVRPTWLGFGVNPPFRPDQPCAHQALPNLDARSGPAPSWAR